MAVATVAERMKAADEPAQKLENLEVWLYGGDKDMEKLQGVRVVWMASCQAARTFYRRAQWMLTSESAPPQPAVHPPRVAWPTHCSRMRSCCWER